MADRAELVERIEQILDLSNPVWALPHLAHWLLNHGHGRFAFNVDELHAKLLSGAVPRSQARKAILNLRDLA